MSVHFLSRSESRGLHDLRARRQNRSGRRAIDPGYGKWVFPGGFVDRGETVEEAAIREAREEVNADVELREVVGVYSYPGVPVVVVVFAAALLNDELEAADECLEIRCFTKEEIPWEELAFSSIHDALERLSRRWEKRIQNTEYRRQKTEGNLRTASSFAGAFRRPHQDLPSPCPCLSLSR